MSVHRHHQQVMPELAPYVDDAQTWRARSALYADLFAKPGTVLFLAYVGDQLAGYGLAHVFPAEGSWIDDTWHTGERVGEIESLAVLPEYRGRGIGGQLLMALDEELAIGGVHDLTIGALARNADAQRLYERHGFRPTWMYLSRFGRH